MSEKMERADEGPDQYRCDSCGTVYTFEELGWIQGYGERVSAGNEAPAGECPDEDCGALCYPVEIEAAATTPAAAGSEKGELYIGMQPDEDVARATCGCTLYRTGHDAAEVAGAGFGDDPLFVMCPRHLAVEAEEPVPAAAATSTSSKYTVVGVFLGSHKTIVQQVEVEGGWQGAWDAAMARYGEEQREGEAYAIIAIFAGHPEAVYQEASL